jgi:hypothetical protein
MNETLEQVQIKYIKDSAERQDDILIRLNQIRNALESLNYKFDKLNKKLHDK